MDYPQGRALRFLQVPRQMSVVVQYAQYPTSRLPATRRRPSAQRTDFGQKQVLPPHPSLSNLLS